MYEKLLVYILMKIFSRPIQTEPPQTQNLMHPNANSAMNAYRLCLGFEVAQRLFVLS